ncbi:methyl-accepting chemotaxis protein [Cryptosporangium japonicum]|uniref:Methyl-accepting chemotaxis protein n=1 Tax=Cryptosporangium japonicum TaxID=80872 RepID=A0ABN0V2U1_9ACTN
MRDAPVGLRPVLNLLDRLRTTARLTLVIVLLVVPGAIATVEYALRESDQIAFTTAERDGVRVLRPTLHAMAAAVGGNDVNLAAIRDESSLGLEDELNAVSDAVSAGLDTPAARLAAAQAFSALVTETGNASNLILDPDLDSFYVMDSQVVQVPRILEAAAAASAATGTTGSADLVAARAVLAGQLSTAAEALETDVKTAVAQTKSTGLEPRLAGLQGLADEAAALAKRLTAALGTPGADVAGVTRAAEGAIDASEQALDGLLRTRADGLKDDRTRVLATTVVGFALAFWLAAAVWWRSRHDVALALSGVRAIADRDYGRHELPGGRDEFGDIGRALLQARERLIEQDEALKAAQLQHEQQARENFAQQRRAEKQARQLAQQLIEESAEALTAELNDVAVAVDAVRTSAGSIHERVDTADGVLRSLLADASNADAVTTALGERLQRVAGMAKIIASVADQTKLLALNATIEAARAGEAGRGFSVVADEVKDLAATTAHSTDEITGTIQALEREATAVSSMITAMTAGIGGVDEATGALLGVADEQRATVVGMEQKLTNALDRVRAIGDLRNLMERRGDERVPLSGTLVFTGGGRRLELRIKDLSQGGVRAVPVPGDVLPAGATGQVEVPVPGVPPLDVDLLRQSADEVVFQFRALPPAAAGALSEFLEAQLV